MRNESLDQSLALCNQRFYTLNKELIQDLNDEIHVAGQRQECLRASRTIRPFEYHQQTAKVNTTGGQDTSHGSLMHMHVNLHCQTAKIPQLIAVEFSGRLCAVESHSYGDPSPSLEISWRCSACSHAESRRNHQKISINDKLDNYHLAWAIRHEESGCF